MINKLLSVILLLAFLLPLAFNSKAEGISVDAGLTPGQDRIIIRMQYRNIINKMGDNSMIMHMLPVVVAYGLSPDITLMMRNAYRAVGTNETMMEMESQWMDPFLMGKVKLYRHNAQNYVIGVAGFAGSTFPVWSSSEEKTYSPVVGINASYRPGLWSLDLNNAHEWVNYHAGEKQSETRQMQLNLAISRNLFIPGFNNLVIAQVQEFSFVRNNPVTGESDSFGFISPGFQIVSPHIKFEGLYQIAVNPSPSGIKNGNRLIWGLRFMF
ncbi:MAG TPA: hypothetical protein VLA03_05655 [Draconibacterium sp.]|nr:hypothetical protein [Draconibacterium sp.]